MCRLLFVLKLLFALNFPSILKLQLLNLNNSKVLLGWCKDVSQLSEIKSGLHCGRTGSNQDLALKLDPNNLPGGLASCHSGQICATYSAGVNLSCPIQPAAMLHGGRGITSLCPELHHSQP